MSVLKIIVDAMGGDLAPKEPVLGALRAAKHGVRVILVGREDAILRVLKEQNVDALPNGVEIVSAPDVVEMHDDPVAVIRQKPESSMVRGLKLLADGSGDALVSAGSTGALLTAATLIVKRIKGIRRAAMGPIIPTATGRCILIDCGANAECTPEFLLQFAQMGSVYARAALQLDQPRVALLNIGTENTKGGALQKEAYALLSDADRCGKIRFIGNIEARDVPLGGADVIVADGFSGNILLKAIEGTAVYFAGQLKSIFRRNALTTVAALACRGGVRELKNKMDYRRVGGTAFIGIRKPVIKAHGASDRVAIENAILQASDVAQKQMAEQIEKLLASSVAEEDAP